MMYKIYAYGACSFDSLVDEEWVGNGAYGLIVESNVGVLEFSGGFRETTNMRVEILGLIEVLKNIVPNSSVLIFSNNMNIIRMLNTGSLNKLSDKAKRKKKHMDLWVKYDSLKLDKKVEVEAVLSKHNPESFTFMEKAETIAKSNIKKDNPIDKREVNAENIFIDLFEGTEKETTMENNENSFPILKSICVDVSCINNPGPIEYRGKKYETGEFIFTKSFPCGTNNIGEFLAIVRGLYYCSKKENQGFVIYSDSLNAMSWVKNKKCKTKMERNEKTEELFIAIEAAEKWLRENESQTQVLKWKTKEWGENPADYGRK